MTEFEQVMEDLEEATRAIEAQATAGELQLEHNRRTDTELVAHRGRLDNHDGRLNGHGRSIRTLTRANQAQARVNNVNDGRFTAIEDNFAALVEEFRRFRDLSFNWVQFLIGFVVSYILVWFLITAKIDVALVEWDPNNAIIAVVAVGFGLLAGSLDIRRTPPAAPQPAPPEQAQEQPAEATEEQPAEATEEQPQQEHTNA